MPFTSPCSWAATTALSAPPPAQWSSRPLPTPPRSPAGPPPHRVDTAAAGTSSPLGRGLQIRPPLPPSWKRARRPRRREEQHWERVADTSALPAPPEPPRLARSAWRGAGCLRESGSELGLAGERCLGTPRTRSPPTVSSQPTVVPRSSHFLLSVLSLGENVLRPPPWLPQRTSAHGSRCEGPGRALLRAPGSWRCGLFALPGLPHLLCCEPGYEVLGTVCRGGRAPSWNLGYLDLRPAAANSQLL